MPFQDSKFAADAKIADAKRQFELKKAQYDTEVNCKKADAELAYKLQEAKENQKIR